MALGLGLWCKQQALFILPLVVLLLWAGRARRASVIRLGMPLALMSLMLIVWDAARPETSVFLLGSVNNLPAQWIADSADWLPRLVEWARLAVWLLVARRDRVADGTSGLSLFVAGGPFTKTMQSRVYLCYVIAYIVLHTVLAFNQYDRYLLLALPPLILFMSSRLPGPSWRKGSRNDCRFLWYSCL